MAKNSVRKFLGFMALNATILVGFMPNLEAQLVISGDGKDPAKVILADPTSFTPIVTTANGLKVDASGSVNVNGRTSVSLVRNDYTGTPVTTAAYTQLVASTSGLINHLEIFDSSGQTMVLAVGGSGSEVNKLYISPGGNGGVDLTIPAGSRISIKAISANATAGELDITFLQ